MNYYQSSAGYVKVNIMKWNNGSEVGISSILNPEKLPKYVLNLIINMIYELS